MVTELKRQNIHVKIMASAGGANAHGVFEAIVQSDDRIKQFADSVSTFINNYKLDGIDIDWEFPKEIHALKFTTLLKVIYTHAQGHNLFKSAK